MISSDNSAATQEPATSSAEVLRVLLIEDNPMDVALVQEMLKQSQAKEADRMTFEFRHAGSLAAAVPYWNGRVDLVLLDLSLPDSMGLATFMRAQALAGDTPIVVLSGLADDALALEAVRHGAQDYLVKWQIGARTLSKVLRYAIERKKGELEILKVNEELEKRTKHQAAASQKRVTVGQMAAGVAQELNNPLSIILGFTQSLIKHPDVEDVPHTLLAIEREAQRCRTLVHQLVSFSRYRKAGMALEDPRAIVEAALAGVMAQASQDKVKLEKHLENVAVKIRGDADQIQQAIVNLCTNALEAMPDGGTLAVDLQCVSQEIQIRVSDTGKGIAPEIRDRIFEPFFTTKDAEKKAGLGLCLVAEIVETHHGRLDMESEPGKGSAFVLSFPLASEN